MRQCLAKFWFITLCSGFVGTVGASGYHPEEVRGSGVGADLNSTGANPVPAVGLLWADFGYLSYHARATLAYRPNDETVFMRGGVAAGFILVLLNFDLTYQTGPQRSAGMFWGLSSFISGASITPEIFAGYQTNFATGAENFFLIGARLYLNLAEFRKR